MFIDIENCSTVPDQYSQLLIEEGVMTREEIEAIKYEHNSWLTEHLKSVDSYKPDVSG